MMWLHVSLFTLFWTVSNYLHTLVKLGLIRREVPATERQPERTRKSRYEVADPYLRFYYRFLEPQLAHIARGTYQAVWQTIERHWRAFVGTHTFEELCREWVYAAAETDRLPFLPQRVGSHWSAAEQIDVVAVNWDEAIVLANVNGSWTVRLMSVKSGNCSNGLRRYNLPRAAATHL
jgi:AAA+ ATPase superfamily predicted ATPase